MKEKKVFGFLHFTRNFSTNLANRFNDQTDISDKNDSDANMAFESVDAWIDDTGKISIILLNFENTVIRYIIWLDFYEIST